MTRCKNIHAMFAEVIDGALPESQQTDFSEHINRCARCRSAFHSYRTAVSDLKASAIFDPGIKPYDAVLETLRGKQTVFQLQKPGRAALSGWVYASALCILLLFGAYTGFLQKENPARDAQLVAFLMQHQASELALGESSVALSGYDQLLAHENTKETSWETILTEFGL